MTLTDTLSGAEFMPWEILLPDQGDPMGTNDFRVKRTVVLTEFEDGTWDGICHAREQDGPLTERGRYTGKQASAVLANLLSEQDS
jgi:hypothetical protein